MKVEKELSILVLIAILIVTCIVWITFPVIAPWIAIKLIPNVLGCESGENCLDIAKLGQFGDLFGGINALFSALAFGGLIYTVFLQKDELALQRKELEETRVEIKGQKEQLQAQNETMLKQTFENRFFQLLAIHQNNTQAIDIRSNGEVIRQGRDCFEYFYLDFKRSYKLYGSLTTLLTKIGSETSLPINAMLENKSFIELKNSRNFRIPEYLTAIYLLNYNRRQSDLGHYFRTIYHTFKFIKEGSIPDEEKRFYASLMRAQLSTYEQLMLFYNCLSPHGFEKFWPIANTCSLFQNMESSLIISPDHLEFYPTSAYE